MKRRISTKPAKAARQRAELKRQGEYAKARERYLYGSQGAAGPVRHIKPEDYKPEG